MLVLQISSCKCRLKDSRKPKVTPQCLHSIGVLVSLVTNGLPVPNPSPFGTESSPDIPLERARLETSLVLFGGYTWVSWLARTMDFLKLATSMPSSRHQLQTVVRETFRSSPADKPFPTESRIPSSPRCCSIASRRICFNFLPGWRASTNNCLSVLANATSHVSCVHHNVPGTIRDILLHVKRPDVTYSSDFRS